MALHFRHPVDLTKYHDMLDWIHFDEKWFFLTQKKERYLILPQEKNPKCCVKHKSHIAKVMFLCAVACPRFNPSALGIWPTSDWEPAKQKSKNRPRGTPVWKNKVVTKEVYRELFISKLLLAIIEKCPQTDRLSRKIYIQQDSAKSHIGEDDEEFKAALAEQDINAKLSTQASNSPDVNLLNLGFF